MRIIRSKSFLTLIIIFFIIGFSTSAKSLIGFPGKTPAKPNATELPGEINPLSVIYPASLQDYRKQTKEYIKAFSKKEREYIIHIFSKGKKFFPKALEIFDKYGVPQELQMIPVLESEFNANAVSPAGAVGHWQFMATLAKEYGLRTGGKYDERKNFSKSA
ncbi:MAG: transglycosylase SLT domain-containing protein, partial [Ginsengibacter sp.]